MQYQVPQFIETEDTILGPLTIRQFIYVSVGVGLILILYFAFNFYLWIIAAVIIGAVDAALAFGKVSGRPLTKVLLSLFYYIWKPRLYIWKKQEEAEAMRAEEEKKRGSPLQDLWLRLSAGKEAIPKREKKPTRMLFGEDEDKFMILEKITGEKEEVKRVDFR